MITLYSESQLEELKKTETRDVREIVGELIWKPILAQYATVKDIYFSPDGILHMLPIEYYSSDGTNSMSEHYNMYRLSSTKELIQKIDKRQPNSAVLYGGLDYNMFRENDSENNASEMPSIWRGIAERGGFDPLFNTVLETKAIKELLAGKNISTTLYSGGTGTEESFRNLSGQSHSIIHLATHGMYVNPDGIDTKKNENNFDFLESLASVNDPVKEDVALTHSFLVMAGGNRVISRVPVSDKNNDGILTSKEISQLDLRGLDLVVLSACESALGDINNGGVYGLQRGFKKGGANTIVMSLGKVDDEATRILMVEFYRNLMNGKTKCQSLYNAQQYLRKVENGKYDDPKYWASFIMLDGLN
jgi:CHAT domain-containing protein